MMFRISIVSIVLILGLILPVAAQEEAGLTVRRATIPNFVTDPIVTGNSRRADDVTKTMPSTFILTLPQTGQTFYRSPALCRLIGINNGDKSSYLEMVAEGPHPLGFSLGAIGRPKFFGFRMIDGLPEFLYTYGQLSVEEKFDVSPDGKKLFQKVKVSSHAIDGAYSVSEELRKMVTADLGRWSNNVLVLKRDELSKGFTITYHLDPRELR